MYIEVDKEEAKEKLEGWIYTSTQIDDLPIGHEGVRFHDKTFIHIFDIDDDFIAISVTDIPKMIKCLEAAKAHFNV